MDEDLRLTVEQALDGDRQAFEMLIRAYSRTVFVHAFAVLQNRAEAEDIAQETFLKAYKSRRSLKDPEKFPNWICTIARNTARDHLKRRRPEPLPENADEIADSAIAKPDRALEAVEVRERIHRVLSSLPEQYRLALTLRYMDGMDHATIGQTMGLSDGALRGILGRGLQAMRKILKKKDV
jgi:RNA polymerase sigma-70 factor (ECF subfamily)